MARNQKPKKDSLITLTKKYANNHDECVKYFFKLNNEDLEVIKRIIGK